MVYPMVSCLICKKECNSRGLLTHFNQNHNPEWKAAWVEKNNKILLALNETKRKNFVDKQISKEQKYAISPSICICGEPKSFSSRLNQFCSESCRASNINKQRAPRSTESKLKTSNTLKGRPAHNKGKLRGKTICHVTFGSCKCCGDIFYYKHKTGKTTCSLACRTHLSVGNRTYTNGRRKLFYVTQTDGSKVMLESSWEMDLAEFLNENNITWSRPAPIKYHLLDGSEHHYYPDFLLDDYGLFLDPKNHNGMITTVEKMSIVSTIIPLWYGEVDRIKAELLFGIVAVSRKFSKV